MCPESVPAETPDTDKSADVVTTAAELRPLAADNAVRISAYEILPNQRLRHLDQGPIAAYAARPLGQVAVATLYALIGEPWLVPRLKALDTISGISNPNFIRVVHHGVVYWPPVKAERYIVIYENNLGQPLLRTHVGNGLGWKNDKALSAVIKPVSNVLQDLRDRDTIHGLINPMNMFDGGSKNIEKIILGDCAAAPASFAQPSIFEPIERAQCDPLGRGLGTFEDDMYALGVTLTILLRSRDPMEGMTDEQVIREKMDQGSYAALTGKERFTGPILELLRGLLYDDRGQRWSLDDMLLWLDGQRLSPKQISKKLKAARQIQFNDERYSRPSMLAMDLDKNLSEAVQLIDGGDLEQWVQRSLEDNVVKNRFEQAVEITHEQGRGPGYPERLASRVSIALDPEAPIRYKGVRVTPEGFPNALIEAVYFKKDLNPYVEIINQQLVMYWLNAQYDMRYDVGATVSKFDSCRGIMRQQNIIYGIERCIYFLAPECPCLSERLREYYVQSPDSLLRAFESMSGKPNRPELFIDRHIASFLSVGDRKTIDPYLAELNAPEMYKRVLGNVKVLATIQQRGKLEPFPGICKWIASILGPYYERIHDRELRQKILERIVRLSEAGDIGKMAALIDNLEMKQKDFQSYRQAMIDYNKLRNEAQTLEDKLAKPEIFAKETGREYAAIISSVVAAIVIVAFVFIYMTQGGKS